VLLGGVVGPATRLWTGWPRFEFRRGRCFLLCSKTSRPSLKSKKGLVQWIPGFFGRGLRWQKP